MLDLKAIAGSKYRITLDESATDETSRSERLWLYQIPCKYGHVGVWGADTLSAWTDRMMIRRRLEFLEGVKVVQRGDREIQVTFAPDRLDAVAELLRARKRKQISPEERARLVSISGLPTVRASATAQETPTEGG